MCKPSCNKNSRCTMNIPRFCTVSMYALPLYTYTCTLFFFPSQPARNVGSVRPLPRDGSGHAFPLAFIFFDGRDTEQRALPHFVHYYLHLIDRSTNLLSCSSPDAGYQDRDCTACSVCFSSDDDETMVLLVQRPEVRRRHEPHLYIPPAASASIASFSTVLPASGCALVQRLTPILSPSALI